MRRALKAITGVCFSVALTMSGPANAACPAGSSVKDWVQGGKLCLAVATYGTEAAGSSPVLVVVLHGDTSSGGRTSEGQDLGRRDSYTADYIGAVGSAIDALKKEYRANRVVLIGHSGGSAYAGVLLGSLPGIANDAIFVSCPCNVPRWREQRGGGAWTRSQSPSGFAAKIPLAVTLVAITGAKDDNTPPQLAQDYVAGLSKRGLKASFVAVPGSGHNFNRPLQEAVAVALKEMLAR